MGAGIAQVSVERKMNCVLKDANQNGLNKGMAQIQKNLEQSVKRKRITE